MIKILNAEEIKKLDRYTITYEPIASIDLMERACKAFCAWFMARYDPTITVNIVCGTGNNGGDGLGIARLLHQWDYAVTVWIVRGSASATDDFNTNFKRLPAAIARHEISTDHSGMAIPDGGILVDALFGSGLTRPVEGVYAEVIQAMNKVHTIRIAVDIPSGLYVDRHATGAIIKASHTVSFQLPKLAFLMQENAGYVGEWHVVDIGLSKAGMAQASTNDFMLVRKSISRLLKPFHRFDHKGTRGKALLIAGSYGKMGAAVLAAQGVLRSGIGLLTVHVPKGGYPVIQTSVPEAMASVDASASCFTVVPELTPYNTIGIGPGLGQDPDTVSALRDLLENFNKPMVLDADALNILAAHRELLEILPPGSILTPHPGEFERLAGNWKNDFDKLDRQRAWAKRYRVVVVVKGAFTSIAAPDGTLYFNPTGNPGMATGGMGDVLTGILTSCLAQGYAPLEAAQLGVWLHGQAGDEAARARGIRGLIASDIIVHLNDSFRLLT
jgi:ADP-dependent NAD(P)H-hydrate dehydratase / NAD(P)H-hydrate epimerase